MKSCPNCGELLGDSVKECFNCHYNYSYGRVITSQEIKKEREKSEKEIQVKIEQQRMNEITKQEQIKRNPLYEYKVEIVNDYATGEINGKELQRLLSEYSLNGWRLHSIFTDEVGKNSTATSISFMGMSVNATIEQTILIFERCIKSLDK